MFDDVSAMLLTDAVEQGLMVVTRRRGKIDKVETSLVESNWVCGCQDAHVLHLRRSRASVAVAVHADVVHHIDIDNILSLLMEILMNSICNFSH